MKYKNIVIIINRINSKKKSIILNIKKEKSIEEFYYQIKKTAQ